jgi:class 3 adenylate cyclase/tetratricopeptide (TPR) repeat protein
VASAQERKVVTVLFADLVDSTAIADGRDPEQVGMILGAYASAIGDAIRTWGGTVEKYIGDAAVGAFGIPTAHEDDPARAVRAAAEVHSRLAELNERLAVAHGVRLTARVGVNTGEVLAGTSAGLDQRFMAGDVVNVAARLEHAAAPGGVLASVRTVEGAGAEFAFADAVDLELKGKAGVVRARPLIGIRPAPTAADGADRPTEAPLIGRSRELRMLDHALNGAIETAAPHSVLILGTAGIGKSRLVREFLARSGGRHEGLRILRGRCLAVGHGVTYWALGEIVRDACAIALDEPADDAAAKLVATTAALFADEQGDETAVAVTHALATTANITIPDNPLERIRPIEVEAAISRAWPRFTSALAAQSPTALVIEDIHWADDQLLTMLQTIVRRSHGALLVLATARPEFAGDHPDFGLIGEHTQAMTLPALGSAEAERLAAAILETKAVDAELRTVLLDRAEGNPFFLEQLIGGLIDSGALRRDVGKWRLDVSTRPAALPDTVQGVLTARIDLLPAAEKRVLQEAAVIGRRFWPAALRACTDAEAVAPALRSLESKDLIVLRESSSVGGEPEYAFKHALVRDVAYGEIPLTRRARSHASVASWLERLETPGDAALVELVAHHYRSALLGDGSDLAWIDAEPRRQEVRARAFPSLIAAGSSARTRNATARALEIHEAALSLAVDDRERAQAFEELGDDHGWSYHGDPSTHAWDQALELWKRLDDDEACARVCLKAARHTAVYWGGFAVRPTGDTVDRYLDEGLRRSRDPLTRAQLLAVSGLARSSYTRLGLKDPRSDEDRITDVEEAAALARELGDPDVQVLAARSLGGLYFDSDRPADALAMAREQLAVVSRVAALRDRLLHTSLALAQIMDIAGEFARAADLAAEVRVLSGDTSAHERMHATYFVMATLFRLGRWDGVPRMLDEHLTAFAQEEVDITCPFSRSGPVVGAIVLDQLGLDGDAATASKAIVPNPEAPGLVEAWMAERALWSDDPQTAVEIASRVARFGRGLTLEEPPYEIPVLIEGLASLGRWDEMHDEIDTALSRASNVAWLAPALDRAHAAELRAAGDRAAAQRRLRQALAAYRRLGMAREAARTMDQLAALDTGPGSHPMPATQRPEAPSPADTLSGPSEPP